MKQLLVLALLTSVALAGCTDGEGNGDVTSADCLEQGQILGTDEEGNAVCVEPPFVIEDFEDPNHYCVQNQQRDRVHAPDLVGNPWQIGQFWTYELEVDGNSSETKLIYYADQDVGADLPLHYMVGTPTREEALQQAIFSVNPMIGRVHSILYSPHESGDHADMFHFPLCSGSSWQTVFYGETFTMTAQDETPDLTVDENYRPNDARIFVIEGTSAEGSTLRIDYDSEVQWFTLIDLDRADGQTVTMTLKQTGDGATGEAFFLRGQQDETVSMNAAPPAPIPGAALSVQQQRGVMREDGGAGPYDTIGFHVDAIFEGNGALQLDIVAPDGSGWTYPATLDGNQVVLDQVLELPYQSGEWLVDLSMLSLSPQQTASGTVTVTAVSIYDQSCTVGGDCLA